MYAIKVVLYPEDSTWTSVRTPCDAAADRVRTDPQSGIAHVSPVAVPPYVVAMTFVMAGSLLAAEERARSAWACWLGDGRLPGWRLLSCEGDLRLGVWAARPAIVSEPE